MQRVPFPILLAAAALAAASGCSGTPSEAPPEPCFRRADRAVATLDPTQAASMAAGRAVCLVYETPLQFDYEARPYRLLPYAAEDMPDVSADGLEVTFRLRDDVWFGPDPCFGTPDGRRRATAQDVVFSLKRLADAKVSSPGYWILKDRIEGVGAFREASLGEGPTDYSLDVPGLQALDDRTVRLRLERPCPDFLWCLALPYAAIVPHEAVETYGEAFGSHEVGSGPFRLAAWRRGHRMLFVRREDRDPARDRSPEPPEGAEGSEPYRAVEYLVMGDASTRWLSFLRGAFDLATEISRDNWDAVITPEGELSPELAERGVRMVSEPALETLYLGFNMEDPVVGTNAALRRALSCAYDAEQWIALNRGRILPASGPVPPGIDGRLEEPAPYAHDLGRARALLAEAGYPGGIDPATGRRLELTLDLGGTDQETREGAELMAAFFDRIGVSLHLSYNTFPQFLQRVRDRKAQLFQISWVADYPDALNFLQLFVSRNASPGPNRANYASPSYDALYDEAVRTEDPARRRELCEAMQREVREACPWIFLGHRREIVLVGPRLRNFRLHEFPLGMEKHWRAARAPESR